MSSFKIKEGLYSVGVLNPNLRVFDVIMRTEYGTSYNSYVVKGQKTALIEASHGTFFNGYVKNIKEVTPIEDIDYIILNHTEPDHSGVLKDLLALCPKAVIYCTRAAQIYLKKITNNPSFPCVAIKDGEKLDLGGLTLQFVVAPFLHWPDSMFTYIAEIKTVITCDFLGTHYCEPNMIDTGITYQDKFLVSFKEYYDAIFSPFKSYVLAGLDKLNALDFDTACVSHGPILTEKGLLPYAREMYRDWSTPKKSEHPLLPVFYCSAYGYTKMLAEEAVKTIKEIYPESECEAYDIICHDMGTLAALMNLSSGFMIGTPTINKDALPPVWELLSHLDVINSLKRPVGVFGSYGWSGEGVPSVIARLAALRIKVVGEGCKANFSPSEEELEKMRAYTKEFLSALQL